MPNKEYWRGKTAMIFGASSGLGRELARELASAGLANLGIVARSLQPLSQVQDWIGEEFPDCRVVTCSADATDPAQVLQATARMQSEFGKLDLVVNAIGQSDRGTIESLQLQTLDELWKVNVISSLNVVQGVRGQLVRPSGCIVLIGSLASLFAPRFLGGYAIVKHALSGLAQQARLELADQGIHVMLACPGPIARPDAGKRYRDKAETDLPKAALQPGGGARLKGLEPSRLARDILVSAARRRRTIIRPRRARLLLVLNSVSPRLGDFLLRKKTS